MSLLDPTSVEHEVLEIPGPLFTRTVVDWRLLRDEVEEEADFATFDDGTGLEVIRQRLAALNGAMREVFALMAPAVPSCERARVYARRCSHLIDLPLGVMSASSAERPLARLPLDLHPKLTMARFAEIVAGGEWPCPTSQDVCVLWGDDFNEGSLVGEGGTLAALDAAAVAWWNREREVASEIICSRGGTALPLTCEAVLSALLGELGPFVQIVGHSDSVEGREVLHCVDGLLDIRELVRQMQKLAREGARSPLVAVDLLACNTQATFREAFDVLGVSFVTSVEGHLRSGQMLRDFRCVHESGLLDGDRPFAHAWIWAALLGPAAVRREMSTIHERSEDSP